MTAARISQVTVEVLKAQDTVDLSKLNAYAIAGSPGNAAATAKLLGYAIVGAPENGVAMAKLAAYAITGAADTFESLSKIVGYAITDVLSSSASRPVVFVAT